MASTKPPVIKTDQEDTLLEFPCKFPVKAMGRHDDDFEALVTKLVLTHADVYAGEQVRTNSSGSGKYISVTVTIEAISKAQIDRIYQVLTDCDQVLIAL